MRALVIDFHCHLDLYPKPAEVVERCHQAGTYVLSVTTTPSAWQGTRGLAAKAPRIRTALGFHPQLAHERAREITLFSSLVADARYVGEIGLDGNRDWKVHLPVQKRIFEEILFCCTAVGGRVMSIHSRGAADEVLDLLEQYPAAGTSILHWFTGTKKQLLRAVDLGCWFSVGPAMLKSANGRGLAAAMPRERVLTESDGPFATIAGQPLYPTDTSTALPILAELWQTSMEEVVQVMKEALTTIGGIANR